MVFRFLLSAALVTLVISQLYSIDSSDADLNLDVSKGATDMRLDAVLKTQEVSSTGQLPGMEEDKSLQPLLRASLGSSLGPSLGLARYLWSESDGFRETGDTEVHPFLGDAWMAGSDLMLARHVWQEVDHSFTDEEDRDVHPFIGDAWMQSTDALVAQLERKDASKDQLQLSRYLWQETESSSFKEEVDMDVHAFIGDAWMAESDEMLARYLWRESESFRETQDMDVHTFVGDAWMAESDLILARYVWRESESTREETNMDVRTFVGDAWMADSDLVLARYLWQESEGFGKTQDMDVHAFLGDAWMAESDLVLARYLWEEEQPAKAELHLARYLWQEAKDGRFVEREDTDVHTFIGDAWMASPDLMLARHLWEEQPVSDEAAKGRVARHLWEKQWEAQPTENTPERLMARHLWEEEPSKGEAAPMLARHLWEEQPVNENSELLMARYLWQEGASNVSIETEAHVETLSYVVSGHDYEAMMVHLNVIGATTTSILPLINTAEVELTEEQLGRLSRQKIAGLMPNNSLQTASVRDRATGQHQVRETEFTKLIEADVLHREGIRGEGVGVAIIDTGMWDNAALGQNTKRGSRVVAYYDAIQDSEDMPMTDESGHGSHISSVIASSLPSYSNGQLSGSYHGVAPDADLIVVKAFDGDGSGTYMDVIRAISYVIEHKEEFNIRVMNLSFSGTPQSHYWEDPINVAVMEAWRAGIVVVASAGNTGPDPLTIGVPGNVPYIVTVGAMTDSYTPGDTADDVITSFSAAGPTLEGHVKPDLIAPGGHMMGMMSRGASLAAEYPQFHNGGKFFEMSGTSQASAVAAGVAALMIQLDPELTPDNVKCRLMASARTATDQDGALTYSLFQQGAGLVNALDAVLSEERGCVNLALDIDADLDGGTHFGGPANQDEDGNFYVGDLAGEVQNSGSIWRANTVWNTGSIWRSNNIWNVGSIWRANSLSNSSSIWRAGSLENSGSIWRASIVWNSSQVWQEDGSEDGSEDGETGYASYSENGYKWSNDALGNAGHIWSAAHTSLAGNIWSGSVVSSKSITSSNKWVTQE